MKGVNRLWLENTDTGLSGGGGRVAERAIRSNGKDLFILDLYIFTYIVLSVFKMAHEEIVDLC